MVKLMVYVWFDGCMVNVMVNLMVYGWFNGEMFNVMITSMVMVDSMVKWLILWLI